MLVVNEVAQPDGSGWSAVMSVDGVLYRATYVASHLDVSMVPYKRPPRRIRKVEKMLRRWAEGQVASLTAEWHLAHQAMYAE